MPSREGNVLLPPGFTVGTAVSGDEILASYARFTQKGYTIKAGLGVIPAGSVMYRETATKKYTNVASGNGVVRGFLRKAVDLGSGATAADRLGNIVLSGILKLSLLKDTAGATLASTALTTAVSDLNARTDADRDWFIF